MRIPVASLLVAALVGFAPAAAAEDGSDQPDAAAEVTSYIVQLAPDAAPEFTGRLFDTFGGPSIEFTEAVPGLGVLAMELTPAGRATLERSPAVLAVEPARTFELFLDESVPGIGADVVHLGGETGAGRHVAILDSGIDTTHPDLTGSVVSEACFLQGSGEVCPTSGTVSATGPGAAAPCTSSPEQCSHGTHVAGIVAAHGTLVGVAPGAGLISIRVTPNSLTIPELAVLAGLDHVLSLADTFDIAAVNLSLGGVAGTCQSTAWESAVAQLGAEGIAVVAASGNDDAEPPTGQPLPVAFPACLDDVISVGATDSTPEVASFTQYAGGLDLVAPGVSIDSSVLAAFAPSRYAAFTGTSMASPHVAGALALLHRSHAGWTPERYAELLRATGEMVTRVTANPGDRNPRFPEIRPAAAAAFTPFPDAANGYWVIASDWAKITGVSLGNAFGEFEPDTTLDRATAVTFLHRLMGSPVTTQPNPFTDVPDHAWYIDAVLWADDVGVTNGKTLTTFEPHSPVTRAQLSTFLWRMVGMPTVPTSSNFSDVPSGAFYELAVDWMAYHGVTTGVTATQFAPDVVISRAQMITFLWRLMNASEAWTGGVSPPAGAMF